MILVIYICNWCLLVIVIFIGGLFWIFLLVLVVVYLLWYWVVVEVCLGSVNSRIEMLYFKWKNLRDLNNIWFFNIFKLLVFLKLFCKSEVSILFVMFKIFKFLCILYEFKRILLLFYFRFFVLKKRDLLNNLMKIKMYLYIFCFVNCNLNLLIMWYCYIIWLVLV